MGMGFNYPQEQTSTWENSGRSLGIKVNQEWYRFTTLQRSKPITSFYTLASKALTCFHNMPPPPHPTFSLLAKWQPLPFLETQPCWQVGTMGHRMKNYGLAAGPGSTMHLSVSQCKDPAYMQWQRKDHSAFASSWVSTENTICTKLNRNAFCAFITKSVS